MPNNDEIRILIADTEKFFKQQQELYGDTIFIKQPEAPLHPVNLNTENMKKKQTIPPAETDVFGNAPEKNIAAQPKGLSALPDEAWASASDLPSLNGMINTCMKCSLGKTRKKFVFGVGNPKADVVVVGEAPGADEDEKGEPFVGRAGQLLTKILEAVQFKREEVFICNILKCRPPNNRDPQPEEIECCEPYLWKQLEIIKPKMILCAGRIAGQSLLKTKDSLGDLRGKMHDYRGIPLMVTYHPAALLRNPNWKRPCWEDVQQFRKLCEQMKKQ
jgi:uracil-DNA glycosylase family 4